MSRDTVALHYISPGHMYMFEFLLYRLNRHRRPTLTLGNHSDHCLYLSNATIIKLKLICKKGKKIKAEHLHSVCS